MLTNADISKLKQIFTTKEELRRMFATKEEVRQTQKSLLQAMIEFKDAILHEIQGLREDVTIITGYKDQIEDHEQRIDSIEKQLHIAP